MYLRVHHKTLYSYSSDVVRSTHLLYLRPRLTERQRVLDAELLIAPTPRHHAAITDRFGNLADEIEIFLPHRTLAIVSEARVSVAPLPELDPNASATYEELRRIVERPTTDLADTVVPYLFSGRYTAPTRAIIDYAARSFPTDRPVLASAIDLMHRIHRDIKYTPGATNVMTPVEHAFAIRKGVCQDLAHAGIACVRAMGLAARYVSGYLITEPPPGMQRLIGADQSHAWFAVYAPPFGWVDLDPTNDVLPSDGHITIGWGRDYGDIAPVSGTVTGGGTQSLEVSVDVAPLAEAGAG